MRIKYYCPFCGESEGLYYSHQDDPGTHSWIECDNCGARGPAIEGAEEDAIRAWCGRVYPIPREFANVPSAGDYAVIPDNAR